MSWFPEQEGSVRTELEPGVRIERRSLLMGGLGLVALAGAPASAGTNRAVSAPGDVEDFLDAAAALARPLMGNDHANEDAYLFRLATLLAELPALPADPFGSGSGRIAFHGEGSQKAGDADGQSVRAIQIGFQPGAKISLHDHLNYSGVILCVAGEMHARNFDVFEEVESNGAVEAATGREVILRETVDALLLPGRFSTLSSTRDNLHELVAGPEGARVLDIFTYLRKPAGSRYLDFVGKVPVDAARRLYRARWHR